ncbi:unnamed protein product, partial [Arabidopsis halleri]
QLGYRRKEQWYQLAVNVYHKAWSVTSLARRWYWPRFDILHLQRFYSQHIASLTSIKPDFWN